MPTYLNNTRKSSGDYRDYNKSSGDYRDYNKSSGEYRDYNKSSGEYRDREYRDYRDEDYNCRQILSHVRSCPICRHMFTPNVDFAASSVSAKSTNVEMSFTSLLLIIGLFIGLMALIVKQH
jgi:hypothetical protein